MIETPEQLDEMIHQMKNHGGLSDWQKDPSRNSINIIATLHSIPKANIPQPNLVRAKMKILDRISLPQQSSHKAFFGSNFIRLMPRFLKISGTIIGTFMIFTSFTVATLVTAMESVPGQKVYPVKKLVESMQLQLAGSEEQKTNLEIKFANNRVEELETILQKQKEGKVSNEQVQKVVASTLKDIEDTTKKVTDQSKDDPKVGLLTKVVDLSSKQVAVIQAAQVESEGEIKIELDKALETSITAQATTIENLERVGFVVEDKPVIIAVPKDENLVTTEGKVTSFSQTTVNIGSAPFLLTKTTEYVNITSVDMKIGVFVKITGEIKDKQTYATKIELVSQPKPLEEPSDSGTTEQSSTTVPVDPQ